MEPLPDLGHALAQLRGLRGLSIREVALAVGASEHAIEAAEEGKVDEALTRKLAANYGIDASTLRNDGFVEPVKGVDSATVFLLHGGYQDFDAQDLGVLEPPRSSTPRFPRMCRASSKTLASLHSPRPTT